MSRGVRLAAAVLVVLGLAGCVQVELASPYCEGGENTLVLMAQAVPSAGFVPCLGQLPSGWTVMSNEIKADATAIQFANAATDNPSGVSLLFTAECDVGDAVEVPSDEEAAQRFETVEEVTDGYRGSRYYVFEGGCVTLRFNLPGEGWSAVVNDSSSAMTFTPREDIEQYVREHSRGVIGGL